MENKNQPAFPTHHNGHVGGLTKREYFAGIAMQGILSKLIGDFEVSHEEAAELIAKAALQSADALLAELEKGGVA